MDEFVEVGGLNITIANGAKVFCSFMFVTIQLSVHGRGYCCRHRRCAR